MDVLTAITARQSIRAFKAIPMPDESPAARRRLPVAQVSRTR